MTGMPSPSRAKADSFLGMRDRYFAPMVLEPYALQMARRVGSYADDPLLEILADTGILTQTLSAFVNINTRILATDVSPEHIAHASSKQGLRRVQWSFADPLALNYPESSFGVVASLFGMAGVSDQRQAFSEARRILRKHGRFAFCLPDGILENPIALAVQDAVEDIFDLDPPRYLMDRFHAQFDYQKTDDYLTEAGFSDSMFLTLLLPQYAPSARDAALAYCCGTPLRFEIEERGDLEEVVSFVEEVLTSRFGTGQISAKMRGYFVTCSG